MQLHGPKKYWEQKRKEHDQMTKKFRLWTLIAAVISLPLLFGVAWVLLPANHPAGTIPWREIGFFLLVSTFLLWALRLLVKLLLSHIHLYADAREREVMISTFMALVSRPESQTSLTKEAIALVLAPLFRPSTTGVIKDEGGPVTLTDFISRIAGGR